MIIKKDKITIDNYLDAIWMERGLSKNSLYSYGRDLKIFSDWLEKQKVSLLDASRRNIQMFLSHRFEQGLSARTTARQLSCFRGFYCYCLKGMLVGCCVR